MKALHIDFGPRTLWRVFYGTGLFSWAALCLGLILTISAGISIADMQRQNEMLNRSINRLQSQLNEHRASKREPKPLVTEMQAAAINKAILQLNIPWRDLLDAVEAATPSTIALLALEPDAPKQLIRITAEAKSGEAMIAYIEDMKRQQFFNKVTLTKHEINEQDSNKPYRFQFEAQWQGDTR